MFTHIHYANRGAPHHSSQISHLLLYPSLWLPVLGLSSHFHHCLFCNLLLTSALVGNIFEKWLQDFVSFGNSCNRTSTCQRTCTRSGFNWDSLKVPCNKVQVSPISVVNTAQTQSPKYYCSKCCPKRLLARVILHRGVAARSRVHRPSYTVCAIGCSYMYDRSNSWWSGIQKLTFWCWLVKAAVLVSGRW